MKTTITTISSIENGHFFFTTDHCQLHNLGSDYVPVTYRLPMSVVPRESLPSGVIETLDDLVLIFYSDMAQIPNPNPEFEPSFN